MIEIVVWLLVSFGTNGQAVTVSKHVTEKSCIETIERIRGKNRVVFDKCVESKIWVEK